MFVAGATLTLTLINDMIDSISYIQGDRTVQGRVSRTSYDDEDVHDNTHAYQPQADHYVSEYDSVSFRSPPTTISTISHMASPSTSQQNPFMSRVGSASPQLHGQHTHSPNVLTIPPQLGGRSHAMSR